MSYTARVKFSTIAVYGIANGLFLWYD